MHDHCWGPARRIKVENEKESRIFHFRAHVCRQPRIVRSANSLDLNEHLNGNTLAPRAHGTLSMANIHIPNFGPLFLTILRNKIKLNFIDRSYVGPVTDRTTIYRLLFHCTEQRRIQKIRDKPTSSLLLKNAINCYRCLRETIVPVDSTMIVQLIETQQSVKLHSAILKRWPGWFCYIVHVP